MPNWAHVKYLLEIMRDLKILADADKTDLDLQKIKDDLTAEIKTHAAP